MTEKLYYKDAYMTEFDAVVISCAELEGGYDILLDRTAFFPNEGGQYSDRGMLGSVRVLNVTEKEGVIHHHTESPIAVGTSVHGAVDFDERYEKMQCHTAEHILSGLIHKYHGLNNVGFHLGADDVTMDISAPLTREELDKIEALANEVVYKNIEVIDSFPSPEELKNIDYRSKLDFTDNVRIVKIGEYDSCACCAPHVKHTGEIGLIKILDFSKLRGGIRIHITAGRRAVRYFRECYKHISAVSASLSVPKNEIGEGVEKLLCELASVKAEYSSYRISVMERAAESVSNTEGNAVFVFRDAATDELIAFSNKAIDKISGILVLLSVKDGDYKYVISSRTVNLREKIGEINKSLLGRGGGKPNLVQGSFACDYNKIFEYFNPQA